MIFFFLIAILSTTTLSAIHAPYVISSPVIEASLEESLLDQKIDIIIKNLKPLEIVSVEAYTIDDDNTKWLCCVNAWDSRNPLSYSLKFSARSRF